MSKRTFLGDLGKLYKFFKGKSKDNSLLGKLLKHMKRN